MLNYESFIEKFFFLLFFLLCKLKKDLRNLKKLNKLLIEQ